jgi:hypothetical protein
MSKDYIPIKGTRYTYDGNIYIIVDGNAEMKESSTGKWLPAVLYKGIKSKTYCRERKVFNEKFKLC